jgi:hypothetical protein
MNTEEIELKYISVDKLVTDLPYQRVVRAAKLKAKFDADLCQPITVSFRGGKYNVVDGQHRVRRAIRDAPGYRMPCRVLRKLTAADEANIFSKMNTDSSTPTRLENLIAAVEAGHAGAVAIKAELDRHGLRLGANKGCVRAAVELETAAAKAVLPQVLSTARAWYDASGNRDALTSGGLGALTAFFAERPNADVAEMQRKLAPHSPTAVVQSARMLQRVSRGRSYASAAADNLGRIYESRKSRA